MSLFAMHAVSCSAGGRTILAVEQMKIESSEQVVLCGTSGSGKTTLITLLSGLRCPDQGRVVFNSRDIGLMTEAEKNALRGTSFGFVLQGYHLIRHMTVMQNIALSRYAASLPLDRKAAIAILERLSIADCADKKIFDLSAGEIQRAAVARAVANDPCVIFADEPTSALDDINAREVIGLLKEQSQNNGAALVVATHDARIIGSFDRQIKIEQGMVKV